MRFLRMSPAVAVAAGVLGGAAALGGAAVWLAEYVVDRLTAPPARPQSARRGFTPFETGVEWEDVSFPTEGGALLKGWLLTRGPDAPAILGCGGYRGQRADLLGISSALWRAGYTVLLFDYRGYGEEPDHVTLGFRELADARAALRYLRERRPEAPLGVMGFSMGAAIAIMLAAREPLVKAVLADSPFTNQREIVRFGLARRFRRTPSPRTAPIAQVVLSLVDRQLARRFGFRFSDVHPEQDVRQLGSRPLFLVHGEADEVIPADHSRRMARTAQEAGVPVETWFVPEAWHCGAYFLDRRTYSARVLAFFRRCLGSAESPAEADRLEARVPAAR